MVAERGAALVVGVGASAGLGAAVARRLAAEDLDVTLMGRTSARVEAIAAEIAATGGKARTAAGDATVPADMARAFETAASAGPLEVAVFNAGGNRPRPLLETDPDFFEEMWRVGCYAGHLFALEAARHMLPLERGTVLFTGASASLRGRAGYGAFASAKAGLRAVAQSMAREFGPRGLHVAHVVIDGGIDGERVNTRFPDAKAQRPPDGLLSLNAVAEAYWQLHIQHRSAWSHELDLRPWCESF
jgi:NAD(P)-dependent dehydrogenase (short-subunit alcohol dehydrogenase family)